MSTRSGATPSGRGPLVPAYVIAPVHPRGLLRENESSSRRGFYLGGENALARTTAWCLLSLLLLGELMMLALPYDVRADLPLTSFTATALRLFERGIRPAVITAALATAFFSRQTLREELDRAVATMGRKVVLARWLALHLGLLLILIIGTLAHHPGRLDSIVAWEGWLILWTLIAAAALVAWCFSLLPPHFWLRWISRSRMAFAVGAALGLVAFALGTLATDFWSPMQRSTYLVVVFLMRLLGQPTIVEPADFVIGTPSFSVAILYGCSGVEGIGLMIAFFSAYLWYCRNELRFPNALALLPLSVVAIWLLNAARITALILLGNWNPDAALKGFHSVAGWLFFNAVAGGLVWASSRSSWFSRTAAAPSDPNPAAPFLLPLLALISASMLARALSPGLEDLYVVGVVAAILAVYFYRAQLLALPWQWSPIPIVAGILAAAVWLLWAGNSALTDILLVPASSAALRASGWTLLALLGGTAIAPVAEELAFRGYLSRRLIDADFVAIPLGRFTWLAFLGSSAAFAVIHAHWLPAMLAGMLCALAMYREGRLSDAIIVHLTAAASVFAYVMAIHR